MPVTLVCILLDMATRGHTWTLQLTEFSSGARLTIGGDGGNQGGILVKGAESSCSVSYCFYFAVNRLLLVWRGFVLWSFGALLRRGVPAVVLVFFGG